MAASATPTAPPRPAWCALCLDFHVHFLHPQVYERTQAYSAATCFGQQPPDLNSPRLRPLLDSQLVLHDLDAMGMDMAVISSADVLQSRSWTDVDEEPALAALVNDRAAEWTQRHASRMVGTFCLPLGQPAHALKELERALAMGLRIANLPSNYRGSYLGEDRYAGLWEALHDQGVVCFIHPDGVRDPWFQNYAMWNSIGQSIEEVKVMSSLIYEGVLERHPGLRIVMAHGGGYMPYSMGRLDRNARYRPQTTKNLSKLPSQYLRDFYYDSCVYDARTLEVLASIVGADRLVLGGDYPFADLHPIALLEQAGGLGDAQKAAIAGANALALIQGRPP